MEKYWIQEKDSFKNGYNSTEGGLNTWPKYLSESARAKISESNKNRKVSDETKKKISESKRGKRYLSDEHYDKLSETLKIKNKGAGNPMYNKKQSSEFKEALSKKYSGSGNPNYGNHMTENSKKKIYEKVSEYYKTHKGPNTGKKLSKTEIQRLREINTDRHPSAESRKKMSDAQKRRIRSSFSQNAKINIGNSKRGIKSPVRRDIVQLDKYMNYIQTFLSASDAGKYLGYYNGSQITACCKGKQKTCGRIYLDVFRRL